MATTANPVARIFRLAQLEKKEISAIYFYAILNGLIQLSLPLGVQAIVGFVLGGNMNASLAVLIGLVVLGVLASGALQIGQMQQIEKIQQKIFVRYSYQLADGLPKIDLRQIDKFYLPELVNRFFEIPILQKGMAKLLLDLPLASIQILFGLILLAFYHPVFILFGIFLVTLLWLMLYYTGSRGLATSLEECARKYKVAAWLEEVARLIHTFKFYQAPEVALKNTDKRAGDYLQSRNSHFRILQFQYAVLVGFKVLITGTMLIVGVWLLLDQQLNIGQFVAAEIIILVVLGSVEKLIINLDNVYDVITSLDKIGKLADQPSEKSGSLSFEKTTKGIDVELTNLSFAYQPGKNLLTDLNLQARAGERVCVTGSPGAGKSTLLRILSGIYSDFEGSYKIDGTPVGNFNPQSIRAQIGILLRQQDIFHGSLFDNIRMGQSNIDRQRLRELSEKLGLKDFLSQMPEGWDSILDPDGRKLPRNVVHKILLIRALLPNPRLLILEDPLSGLDEPYRSQFIDLIKNDFTDTTIIVSGIQPELLNACNRVWNISEPA
ncbi:MAG: peptidase domain-containing ABC transporter [Chitinophagaceae bacterium]